MLHVEIGGLLEIPPSAQKVIVVPVFGLGPSWLSWPGLAYVQVC